MLRSMLAALVLALAACGPQSPESHDGDQPELPYLYSVDTSGQPSCFSPSLVADCGMGCTSCVWCDAGYQGRRYEQITVRFAQETPGRWSPLDLSTVPDDLCEK